MGQGVITFSSSFPQRNLRTRGGVEWGNNIENVRKTTAPNLVYYSPVVVYQKKQTKLFIVM